MNYRKRRSKKSNVAGSKRIRLSVFRSNTHIYAQLIDDQTGKTICAANSLKIKKGAGNRSGAAEVGRMIADVAKKNSVKQVVFDRGNRIYAGRIKELATAAREAGLEF